MTVIVIRDGMMAADSMVQAGGVLQGSVVKVLPVSARYGGGFVGASGDLSHTAHALKSVAETGKLPDKKSECCMMWLQANGDVLHFEGDGWYEFDAPYYAIGSGSDFAMGALAMGATAAQAVDLVCDHVVTCAGPTQTYALPGRNDEYQRYRGCDRPVAVSVTTQTYNDNG